jgi:GNAT superfamily N-acetyltransferase
VGFGAGQVVTGIDIRSYAGDFGDVAELNRKVWIESYGGRMWFPLWDPAFLRCQFGVEGEALCLAAFDGATLVGSSLTTPYSLRIGSSALPIGLTSLVTVEPQYRHLGVTMRLLEALRRRQQTLGIAFSLGIVTGDRASLAHRFWAQYAKTYPQNLRFLFGFGIWTKILAPAAFERAAILRRERWGAIGLGPILRLIPFRQDPDIRAYRVTDLIACARLLDMVTTSFDWALVWTPERLARQLCSPGTQSIVLERDGRLRAMVNYHCMSFHGREPIRAALIDLWADDGLTGAERTRLLSHVCHDLRKRGVHLVLALRCAMMPTIAFAANLFIPFPFQGHLVAMFPQCGLQLPQPKAWSLVMR